MVSVRNRIGVSVTSLGVIITVCFGGVCSGRQDIVYPVAGGLL